MTWKQFSNDREIKPDPSGFVTIRPVNRDPTVPLFCPVCTIMMRTDNDSSAWRESDCCHQCSMRWVEPDRQRWAGGWRPSAVDVSEDIKRRRIVPMGVKLEAV